MSASSPGASASPTEVDYVPPIDYKGLLQPILDRIEKTPSVAIRSLALMSQVPASSLVLEGHTAAISGPRQTGKTTAMIDLSNSDDIIVVQNQNYERILRKILQERKRENADWPQVITLPQLTMWIADAKRTPFSADTPRELVPGLLPVAPRRVFVDNATFALVGPKPKGAAALRPKDVAWWCAQHSPTPTLVLIG